MGWKGPLEITIPSPLLNQVSQSKSHREVFRWVVSISREGDSANPLGRLFLYSVILMEMFFLMFRWNILCSSLCLRPPVLSLDTTERVHTILLLATLQILINTDKIPPQSPLLQAEHPQSLSFLIKEVLQPSNNLFLTV